MLLLSINIPIHADENFQTLHTNTLLDQSGFIHLFGEIRNVSGLPQKDIAIHANFYDQSGKIIGNGSGIAAIRSLNSGQVSPFEIIFLDKDQTQKYYNHTLHFESKATLGKPESITIKSSKSRLDIFGYYYISGRILNEGNRTATNVLAISSFYDKVGKIIGLSSAIAEPTNITSLSTSSFTIVMDDKLQSPKIKGYHLIIDSDQFVSR